MMMIEIRNDGPRITGTNYFDTEHAQRGLVYLTINAGALRLLVPPGAAGWLEDMRSAEYVIATLGEWTPEPTRAPDGTRRQQHPREAVEMLFEDHTDSPFSLHLDAQQVDRLPARQDAGRTDLRCLVYTAGPELRLDLPARLRRARRLPYLKPWSER